MNKLPWFTHDNDAHEDIWIQTAMDKFGHFGYAAYFILIELLDRHGTGDSLIIPRWKLAQKLRSRWPQVRLYLEFSRSSGKVDYNLIGDEVQLQIKKFRERQSKLKSKLPATFRQSSRNLPREREGEREYTPLPPKEGDGQFEELWKAYPRKVSKAAALKSWHKLKPGSELFLKIMGALSNHKTQESWQKDGGQFIPHLSSWLNKRRFDDELSGHDKGGALEKMPGSCRNCDVVHVGEKDCPIPEQVKPGRPAIYEPY